MVLVFDIDGTVMESELMPDGHYKVIRGNKKIIRLINKHYAEGDTIIMETARHWLKFEETRKQLFQLGINYHTLVCGKPVADFYIDDRGMSPEEFVKKFTEVKKDE